MHIRRARRRRHASDCKLSLAARPGDYNLCGARVYMAASDRFQHAAHAMDGRRRMRWHEAGGNLPYGKFYETVQAALLIGLV